jgi:mono/diheme cytochrome c family protein
MIVAAGPVGRMMGSLTVVPVAGGDPAVVAELLGLSAEVPDTPWVTDLYNAYIKEAKGELPPDWERKPALAAYEPAENCAKCHEQAYQQWRTTLHSHAFATLQKVSRQGDPECIVCHTVGYGRGGFTSDEKTPGLKNVTCQACHLVTSAHGEKGAPKEELLDSRTHINSRLCIGCHGLTESPNFDYAVYRPKIVHKPTPAEGK